MADGSKKDCLRKLRRKNRGLRRQVEVLRRQIGQLVATSSSTDAFHVTVEPNVIVKCVTITECAFGGPNKCILSVEAGPAGCQPEDIELYCAILRSGVLIPTDTEAYKLIKLAVKHADRLGDTVLVDDLMVNEDAIPIIVANLAP